MNAIALAGGTTTALFVDDSAALSTATICDGSQLHQPLRRCSTRAHA